MNETNQVDALQKEAEEVWNYAVKRYHANLSIPNTQYPNFKDGYIAGHQSRDAEIARLKEEIERLTNEGEVEYQPYFGWCDVEGCENEGASGGIAWREGGYWTVCPKHSQEWRAGKQQPPMKQSAIDREKTRGADGILQSFTAQTKPND